MPLVPALIIDKLNGLLEAEVNSIFRFVGEGSPYLDNATAEVRRPLAELYHLGQTHIDQLAELIESLGGIPRVKHRVRSEEQYLAFLSMKFLLPKLVDEKNLILARYENARSAVGAGYPAVAEFLKRIESEQRKYLDMLKGVSV